MEILILIIVLLVIVLAVGDIRRSLITKPVFKLFKRILPPLSDTEREAMEAGDIWWDGELFSGRPDWQKLLETPEPKLTSEEQAFVDNQLAELLDMLDDFKIVQQDRDLPKPVWDFLRKEHFFAMIIGKKISYN